MYAPYIIRTGDFHTTGIFYIYKYCGTPCRQDFSFAVSFTFLLAFFPLGFVAEKLLRKMFLGDSHSRTFFVGRCELHEASLSFCNNTCVLTLSEYKCTWKYEKEKNIPPKFNFHIDYSASRPRHKNVYLCDYN